MAPNFDLKNKTIVLTGSAGRVGSQFSEILSEAGANLILRTKSIQDHLLKMKSVRFLLVVKMNSEKFNTKKMDKLLLKNFQLNLTV